MDHILYGLVSGMGSCAKPMEWQGLLSFLSGGGGKKLFVALICILGRDFLSLHPALVSSIKSYPNTCIFAAPMICHCRYCA